MSRNVDGNKAVYACMQAHRIAAVSK